MNKMPMHSWMSECDPQKRITALLIPGTHDTMTADCQQRYYRTQHLSLSQQLQTGVRFLDIRLRKEMVAAHREWISDIHADQIFTKCGEFLAKNPHEFILMRIQNANENKDDYPQYGTALLEKIREYSSLFYQWQVEEDHASPAFPNLKEAAGKILSLECSPPEYRFNYNQHQCWATNWHQNSLIHLQDLWNGPSLAEKQQAIEQNLWKSQQLSDDYLSLNHISATNGSLGYPDAYANHLNPYSLQLWQNPIFCTAKGVQIYDFIEPMHCQKIIECNFC